MHFAGFLLKINSLGQNCFPYFTVVREGERKQTNSKVKVLLEK